MQIAVAVGVTVIVGNARTVTTLVARLIQPLASVPVTVYVVVTTGDALTVDPVELLNPVDGDHE